MTNCDQFSEDYELYALGLLESPEKEAFEQHLADGCANCSKQVKMAIELNEIISGSAPPVQPPDLLRQRIMASFVHAAPLKRRAPMVWPLVLAAAAVVILALAAGWMNEHQARVQQEATLEASAAQLSRMASAVQILQAPGVKQVTFGPQPTTPHGSLFIHDKLGILLIAGNLPAAPSGFRYESWIVPKNGAPRPVEPFQANRDGRAISLIPGPLNVADVKAVAVSIEPDNVPAVTPTKVILAAPLGE
jgi:Anti-sigma-K factor rskA